MAMLAGTGLFIIQHVLPKLRSRDSALGISKMAMAWNVEQIIEAFGQQNLPFEKDVYERIKNQNSIFNSKDFFELAGIKRYEDIDFDASEGCSIIHDMNQPLPKQYENRFDFVIENGTIEHIFDIKTAIGNIAKAVKVGGLVCHVSPLDAFNHGFYNFSVNFFNDFYRANGFDSREFYLLRGSSNWGKDQNLLVEALTYTHEEFYVRPDIYDSPYNKLGIGFTAVKTRHIQETVVPVQAAYDPELRIPSRLNRYR
jgi:SAM-dependent methyltransferase